ncbi:PASTA domain-containing protein, partial [Pseudomonas sp. 2995-3]
MREINQAYYELELDVTGEGKEVVLQSPDPGVKVKTGSKIRVHLGDKDD